MPARPPTLISGYLRTWYRPWKKGVYLNVGSAVILPEIFLKATSLVRNLGHKINDFTTVNMDFIRHYRPMANVVNRPTATGGRGFNLIGHHEIMLPLLAAGVLEQLKIDGLVKSPSYRYASLRVCVALLFVIIQRTMVTLHDYQNLHALNLNFLRDRLNPTFYEFINT